MNLSCLVFLSLMTMLSPPASAVSTRTEFTLHMYVDPIYGDDQQAWSLNPNPNGSWSGNCGKPLQEHPNSNARGSSTTHNGLLVHCPYSFKTLNGGQGAINFLRNFFPNGFPYVNPENGRKVNYVVIHLGEGLYSDFTSLDPQSGLHYNGETFPVPIPPRVSLQGTSALSVIFDARRAEGKNIFTIGGKCFPALDPPIPQYKFSFLDSVTIRGCRGSWDGMSNATGAGVLIWKEYEVFATISNCFIYDNEVGIAIVKAATGGALPHEPRIVNNTIIENRIGVWNGQELSGSITESYGVNYPALLNNLISSATSPLSYWTNYPNGVLPGVSCFEGMHKGDMHVANYNGTPVDQDFNAYEVNPEGYLKRYNLGSSLPYPSVTRWLKTKVRGSSGNDPGPPRVDLWPFTQPHLPYGLPAPAGGILLLRHVFEKSANFQTPSNWYGACQHDLRLSPIARYGALTNVPGAFWAPNAPVKNPLINQGVDFGFVNLVDPCHNLSLSMGNAVQINYSPGLPPAGYSGAGGVSAMDYANCNAWDWDCDGFGNKRVARRAYFTRGAPVGGGLEEGFYIDIGADESHELTISGYLDDTRIFSHGPGVSSVTQNLALRNRAIFFNLSAQVGGPGVYPTPQYNYAADYLAPASPSSIYRRTPSDWYSQIQYNPSSTPPHTYGVSGLATNYTKGQFDTGRTLIAPAITLKNRRWFCCMDLVPVQNLTRSNPSFMRNLFCDISPHLFNSGRGFTISDLWGELVLSINTAQQIFTTPYAGYYSDPFQSNPWYHQIDTNPDQQWWVFDNGNLYWDPNEDLPTNAHRRIQIGMLNPPRTVPRGLQSSESYLSSRTGEWTLILTWGSVYGQWSYTVDNWGATTNLPNYGVGYPLYWLGGGWQGLRYNIELLLPGDSYWEDISLVFPRVPNSIQTCLIVEGPDPITANRSMNLESPAFFIAARKTSSIYPGSEAAEFCSTYLKDLSVIQKKLMSKQK